ncbi:MAG TPA: homoserine dehydrogenase, partial [Terriglobia bacterium]|nr:homoserine dehydrogenase [Terriglobia bacterium]
MKNKISVGLIGFGTVGTGAYRILTENAGLITERLGVPVEIKRIAVRDLKRDRGVAVPSKLLTDNPSLVVEDPDIDIVVELIGGYQPAKDLILAAFARGKHVVTANKALLASSGAEIRAAARKAGLAIGFEGSVGGGVPIIKALGESLAANRILSLYGIINGTTNYILTKMTEEDRAFADVLAEAQRAGYAEADPTFDVGGIDTAHKLTVLVNLAFGAAITSEQVFTEGISSISPVDIEFGKEFGYRVKLLAIAKSRGGSIEARVHPTMVPEDYPIAKVGGVYNAIQIVGDACGDIMLYGRGAGAMPTGSAVVADIMDIGRSILVEPGRRLPTPASAAPIQFRPMDDVESIYYTRFMAMDRPGVLSQISGVFGRQNISIASVIQRGRKQDGAVPLVIMTHTARERDMRRALTEIRTLDTVSEEPVLIR